MDEKTALIEWGLNDKESEVYLYLIKRGLSSSTEISKETGILRQTTYEVLDKLINKSLVSQQIRTNKKQYEAINPNQLIEILEQKKETVNHILPKLKTLFETNKNKENVQIFKGIKGIKYMLQDALNANNEILSIQPIESEKSVKEYYISNFIQKRKQKKIPIRIIRPDSTLDIHKQIISNKPEKRQVRILKQLIKSKTHFVLFNNKLNIMIHSENIYGISIEDNLVVESFKLFFEILWNLGKQI